MGAGEGAPDSPCFRGCRSVQLVLPRSWAFLLLRDGMPPVSSPPHSMSLRSAYRGTNVLAHLSRRRISHAIEAAPVKLDTSALDTVRESRE